MTTPDTRPAYQRLLRDMSSSDRDYGAELLDEAQAAFEEQAAKHPDINPTDAAGLLEYIHRMLGTSPTPTPTPASLTELGKLLGNRTAHAAEVMMGRKHGTTFGDTQLMQHVQFLFAGVSIAEEVARKQAEEKGSEIDIPWAIQGFLDIPYDKANEVTIRGLYELGLPQHAASALRRTQVHNQEI